MSLNLEEVDILLYVLTLLVKLTKSIQLLVILTKYYSIQDYNND